MVAIASVHALGPEVFALDEPTAALDVASMRTLAHLVRRLKELGAHGDRLRAPAMVAAGE